MRISLDQVGAYAHCGSTWMCRVTYTAFGAAVNAGLFLASGSVSFDATTTVCNPGALVRCMAVLLYHTRF